MNELLFFLLGIGVTIYVSETYAEKRGKKIEKILSKKLARLLEECSMQIGIRQKQLNRDLTEDEKDNILDKCYREI